MRKRIKYVVRRAANYLYRSYDYGSFTLSHIRCLKIIVECECVNNIQQLYLFIAEHLDFPLSEVNKCTNLVPKGYGLCIHYFSYQFYPSYMKSKSLKINNHKIHY